eukprot:2439318-Amphidinium_carterae.1
MLRTTAGGGGYEWGRSNLALARQPSFMLLCFAFGGRLVREEQWHYWNDWYVCEQKCQEELQDN